MSTDSYPYLQVGDRVTINTTAGSVHGEIVDLHMECGQLRSVSVRELDRDDPVHVHWATVTLWRLGRPAAPAPQGLTIPLPAGMLRPGDGR